MIHLLEELSGNAWPALQVLLYDGWVLRFAEGYTRRANSITPLYPSALPLAEKIASCEAVYAARGQPTIFKITSAAELAALDDTLDRQGYAPDALTSVQVLDDLAALPSPAGQTIVAGPDLSDAWLADFCALSGLEARRLPTIRRLLGNIIPARCFMALRQDGETIAAGLGVLERGHLGIFDVVTAAHRRNQGFGSQLMLSLLHWGRTEGARRAYLQVMLNNAPALHLYEKLGFQEVYRYWYRVKALP